MLNFLYSGGFFMVFELICLVLVLGLAVRAGLRMLGKNAAALPGREIAIHAVLFWGSMALVLGFLSHYMGLYGAMEAISRANDISPGIVAKGYQMALVSVLSGMVIFIISMLLWFLLRWRFQQLMHAE